MAAPTLIASVQIDSPWAQTYNIGSGVATKNYPSTLTTAVGDLIVAVQGADDASGSGALTASDGVNSYTQRAERSTTNHCCVSIHSASDGAGGTRTLTLTRAVAAANNNVGGIALQFRDHGGVGNVVAAADGIQTANLTCSANSAILVICLDWNATTGSRTWATINGNSPTATYGVDGNGANWAAAGAYWADVGGAGSKTITLTAPTFGAASFAAIEILGGASGPIFTDQPDTQTVREGTSATFTVAATVTGTPSYQWKKNGSNVGTNSASYTFTPIIADSGAQITCTITDDNGNTTSATAYLYVLRDVKTARRKRRRAAGNPYAPFGTVDAAQWFDRGMVYEAAAGGGTAPVGRADETDAALTLAGKQIKAAGLASETGTALALTGRQVKPAGLATEADTAFALAGKLVKVAGRADETDTALAPVGTQIKAAGRADEADTALGLSGVQIKAAGRADEADTAFALTAAGGTGAGLAAETDTAFALTGRQIKAAGAAVEADTALATPGVQIKTAGLATEADAALALSGRQIKSAGRADETDTALALLAPTGNAAGRADETDVAIALQGKQIKPAGLAVESSAALSLAGRLIKSAGLAAESDVAFALAGMQAKTAGRADEADTAYALASVLAGDTVQAPAGQGYTRTVHAVTRPKQASAQRPAGTNTRRH